MSNTQGRILRTTAYLTIGTFVAQGLGTASQFLLAAWLTPSDFGLFAGANASLFVLFALVNLGDVTGYLSNQGWSERLLLRTTLKLNLVLALIGLIVASLYVVQDRVVLGWLVALLALHLPLMGRSLALYAIAVRHGRVRLIVLSQMAAASLKLLVGVVVAATCQSPVALALALIAYSALMTVSLEVFLRRKMPFQDCGETPLRKARFKWAMHSLSQAFPTQIDYAVVAIVSSPYVLGLYYFAYQATAGISALLTGPLMKSSLAEFGQLEATERSVAISLLKKVTGAVTFTVVCLSLAVYAGQPFFPDAWAEAPAVIVLLLGSLPSRFVTPVAEARQVSDNRWWRSASLNTIDAMGTAGAALVALTGSVLALAGAIAIWKLTVAVIRIFLCFPESGPSEICRAIVWPILSVTTCFIAALTWSTGFSWQILSLAATIGAVLVVKSLLTSRRRAMR